MGGLSALPGTFPLAHSPGNSLLVHRIGGGKASSEHLSRGEEAQEATKPSPPGLGRELLVILEQQHTCGIGIEGCRSLN